MEKIRSISSFKKRYYPKTYLDELVTEEEDPYDTGNRLAERALEKVKIEMKLETKTTHESDVSFGTS